MTWPFALIASTVAWLVWIPAAAYQRAARGERGGVSIFPVIPCFPLAACGFVYWADLVGMKSVGIAIVAGHVLLLAALLVSITKSRRKLRQRGQAT